MPKGVKGFQKGNKCRPKAPHTLEREEMRRTIVERIAERLEPLLDAKFDLALGHYRIGSVKNGTIRIYRVSPDGNAIQYLFNQAIGKPTETIKVDEDVTIILDI